MRLSDKQMEDKVLYKLWSAVQMRRFVGDPLETSRRPSHHDAVSGLVWHHRGSDGHGWITYVVHKEANVSLRLPFNITVNMSHGGVGGGSHQDTERAMAVMGSEQQALTPATRPVSPSLLHYG